MADTSLVETAIVTLLGGVLYPNGTSSPSALGVPANVERGWPTEADIRAAVSKNMVLMRVHAVIGLSKDDTRFPRYWLDQSQAAITLTATLIGYTLTFAGTPAAGQVVRVYSNGVGTTYVVGATDTLTTIAAGIAAEISGATSSGAVLTLPNANITPSFTLQQFGPSSAEVGRECQMFTVATWAPSPALRDATLQLVYANLAYTYRMVLADGSTATLMDIQATGPDDEPSRAGEWRRDLRLNYDYPILLTQSFPPNSVPILELT